MSSATRARLLDLGFKVRLAVGSVYSYLALCRVDEMFAAAAAKRRVSKSAAAALWRLARRAFVFPELGRARDKRKGFVKGASRCKRTGPEPPPRRAASATSVALHVSARTASAASDDAARAKMLRARVGAPLLPPLDRDSACTVCDSGAWDGAGACRNLFRLDCACRSVVCGHCAMRVSAGSDRPRCPTCVRPFAALQRVGLDEGHGSGGRAVWRSMEAFVNVAAFLERFVPSAVCAEPHDAPISDEEEEEGDAGEDYVEIDDVVADLPCAYCSRCDDPFAALVCEACEAFSAHYYCASNVVRCWFVCRPQVYERLPALTMSPTLFATLSFLSASWFRDSPRCPTGAGPATSARSCLPRAVSRPSRQSVPPMCARTSGGTCLSALVRGRGRRRRGRRAGAGSEMRVHLRWPDLHRMSLEVASCAQSVSMMRRRDLRRAKP